MRSLICLLFVQFFAHNVVAQQATYKAAVVEYAPRLSALTPETRLLENMQDYREFMEQAAAKDVQIIVFPEDGLTGWEGIDNKTVHEFSTEVPEPAESISPCSNPHANYSKYFIDLSCAAQTHKIYTVLNLIEREYDNKTNKMIYHNTNVVFDKNGGVIARYRKINLFNEPIFVPGNETVTFKTDFGVTFGMFICFDIMFKNPALDVLADPAVTDIVYSAAWFSELPFYGAVSIQDGYAKSNGVNLLASGLDSPSQKNGGSGIYLANGRIAESYISGIRASKMIIQDVPKITARTPSASCEDSSGPPSTTRGLWGEGSHLPNISAFQTTQENTVNYTFKALNLDNKVTTETICSGKSKFCCSFDIAVNRNSSVQLNYVYKLLVYYGVSPVSSTRSLGLGNCALVACLNDTNSSCGGRHTQAPEGVTFERISVKGSFNPTTSHPQPATLKYNLQPVSGYTYCTKTVKDVVEVEIALTQPQDSLLSFGIHGRIFYHDDKPAGLISRATFFAKNTLWVFIISIIVFLLQD